MLLRHFAVAAILVSSQSYAMSCQEALSKILRLPARNLANEKKSSRIRLAVDWQCAPEEVRQRYSEIDELILITRAIAGAIEERSGKKIKHPLTMGLDAGGTGLVEIKPENWLPQNLKEIFELKGYRAQFESAYRDATGKKLDSTAIQTKKVIEVLREMVVFFGTHRRLEAFAGILEDIQNRFAAKIGQAGTEVQQNRFPRLFGWEPGEGPLPEKFEHLLRYAVHEAIIDQMKSLGLKPEIPSVGLQATLGHNRQFLNFAATRFGFIYDVVFADQIPDPYLKKRENHPHGVNTHAFDMAEFVLYLRKEGKLGRESSQFSREEVLGALWMIAKEPPKPLIWKGTALETLDEEKKLLDPAGKGYTLWGPLRDGTNVASLYPGSKGDVLRKLWKKNEMIDFGDPIYFLGIYRGEESAGAQKNPLFRLRNDANAKDAMNAAIDAAVGFVKGDHYFNEIPAEMREKFLEAMKDNLAGDNGRKSDKQVVIRGLWTLADAKWSGLARELFTWEWAFYRQLATLDIYSTKFLREQWAKAWPQY